MPSGAKRRPADATTHATTERKHKMDDADLLYGLPAIAGQLGLSNDQVRHLAKSHGLPTFKLGRSVCARRSTLMAWLAEREEASRARSPKPADVIGNVVKGHAHRDW